MKYTLILIIMVLVFSLASCDHRDPERREINQDFDLFTLNGDVALIKNSDENHYQIITTRNFVAYVVLNNNLILCEQLEDDSQDFWTFNLKSEKLNWYNTYSEMCAALDIKDLELEPLWVREFNIQDE